jgi:hypothetical protein
MSVGWVSIWEILPMSGETLVGRSSYMLFIDYVDLKDKTHLPGTERRAPDVL